MYCSRFLYAFHNKDFRDAFQKTLSKYFVCCRQRRRNNAMPLPPCTPIRELPKASSNRPNVNRKRSQKDSRRNTNESVLNGANRLMQGTSEPETPNRSLISGENNGSS